ncbi:Atrn, partial [Symbiodinium sp. CCMP2592]
DNTLTATADVGGSSEADCICSAGFFREQVAGCIPCRGGYYKPNDGDQDGANVQFWFQREVADCRNSCPTNGDSKEGAVDVGDCYYLIVSPCKALVHIDSLLRSCSDASFSSWEVNLSALEDTVHGQLFGMRKYPDACSECRSSFSWMGLVVFTDIAQNILINFAVASLAAMAAATLAAMTSIFPLRFDMLDDRC